MALITVSLAILPAGVINAADNKTISPEQVSRLAIDFRAQGSRVTGAALVADLKPCQDLAPAGEADQIKTRISFRVSQSDGTGRTMIACVCRYPDGTESWTYYPGSVAD